MALPLAIFGILGEIAKAAANKFFPDPAEETKRLEMEHTFTNELIAQSQKIEELAANVVKTEAESEHWLTANWRPITMLLFVALIIARWLGFTAPNMTESEYLAVYNIINVGLGGYVIGRSAEKIVPAVVDVMKKKA